jgi:hypothetical protein
MDEITGGTCVRAEDGTGLGTALQDLALANRILANEGIVDDFGHVAFRDASRPGHFWLSRAVAPAAVTTGDLRLHDAEGRASTAPCGNTRRPCYTRGSSPPVPTSNAASTTTRGRCCPSLCRAPLPCGRSSTPEPSPAGMSRFGTVRPSVPEEC